MVVDILLLPDRQVSREVYIYLALSLGILCSDNDNIANWYMKKYEILEMPLFLSININVNDYKKLVSLYRV